MFAHSAGLGNDTQSDSGIINHSQSGWDNVTFKFMHSDYVSIQSDSQFVNFHLHQDQSPISRHDYASQVP